MEHILEETVSSEDLKKFEQKYHEELNHGKVIMTNSLYFILSLMYQVSATSQFEYAWCLVRSRYPADIRKGIILLEDLFQVCNIYIFDSTTSLSSEQRWIQQARLPLLSCHWQHQVEGVCHSTEVCSSSAAGGAWQQTGSGDDHVWHRQL